ncbi:hypothetical protein [Noviherbaspirillum pedocola]|uniref:Uncharacterized protein n=1 Tax=Noviherbaspirillum pedocola TaxID=2801341 RepID=A0A934W262_9BURK|nr:hypothetical protein [Noviherbaspirillum pedocola]MBK4735956.1 hypothetical protein [Noviherbaspirillum pedocola]
MKFEDLIKRPKKHFTFALEPINSCTGISYDTLQAIAESYGTSEEQVVLHALSQLAEKEIPDFDPDSPFLSEEQLKALLKRRHFIDAEAVQKRNSPSLRDHFLQAYREQGDTDGKPEDPVPDNGKSP